MANDILVKIGADAKQFKDEIDSVKAKTDDLKDVLGGVAKASGLVFAALAGSAGLAIKAFADSEKATSELTVALENQGKSAAKLVGDYKKYADAVSKATGVDDDAIVSAQAKLQALIGQAEITPELTAALVDLSTETGSLDSAAEKLGLVYQGNTGFFNKQRIAIDENATAQDRLNQAVAGVQFRFGGLAEAQASGVNSVKKLNVAFGNLLENVGQKLAPAFTLAVNAVTKFVSFLDTPGVLDFGVAIAEVIAAFAGGLSIITGAGLAFIKMKEGLAIANIAIKAIGLTARGALLASGVGALIVIATLVYENWSTVWPAVQAVFVGAVTAISEAASGLGKILGGILNRDFSQIKEGYEQLKDSVSKGFEAGTIKYRLETERVETGDTVEDQAARLAQKKALADKAAEEQRKRDELNREESRNNTEIAFLQALQGSEELIKIKQQENEVIKQLETEKNEFLRQALTVRLADLHAQEALARETAKLEEQQFNQEVLASNAEFQALDDAQRTQFLQKNAQQLKASQDTEAEARNKFVANSLKQQIESNNLFLQEQIKYETAYATLQQVMRSDQLKGAQQASSNLIALQGSQNAELKAIGKAAAITDITIKTAQAALAIYAGFQTAIPFPPVSIPLGIAGAAAAIAFGAEQIGRVISAADGGVITGGIPGKDSVPLLGMPGELVVPTKNFEEVVGAVKTQRDIESGAARGAGVLTDPAIVDTLTQISEKLSQPPSTQISIQGDVYGDDAAVDKMIRKINDAVQFRNAKLITGTG